MPQSSVINDIDINSRISLESIFNRVAPLEIDLGCGKGRFLSVHASRYPEINFIGIERKQKRVEKVDKKLQRLKLDNVRLIRIEAEYFIENMLPDNCLTTLYIYFPDPWPKRKHQRRRIFSPDFMNTLTRILTRQGIVHLATDHDDYFEQMKKVVAGDDRFTETTPYVPGEEERSEFETTFLKLGKQANRLSFRLR